MKKETKKHVGVPKMHWLFKNGHEKGTLKTMENNDNHSTYHLLNAYYVPDTILNALPITSFNPFNNCMKQVLLLSHFIDKRDYTNPGLH